MRKVVAKRALSMLMALVMILGVFSYTGIDVSAKKGKQQVDVKAYAAIFDASYYTNKYPDVAQAIGANEQALFSHFINCGMVEGRQGCAEFNVQVYKAKYTDLRTAFGDNLPLYYQHYLNTGKAEGRTATSAEAAAIANPGQKAVTPVATPAAQTANPYDPQTLYNIMISFSSSYPEGMRYTNEDYYQWRGGIYRGGYGCAGFAFMLSDACFGDLPARKVYDVNSIRVGDVVRVNNDAHSVIVLKIENGVYTVAEANYNSSVHWGRTFTYAQMCNVFTYNMTRYPQ